MLEPGACEETARCRASTKKNENIGDARIAWPSLIALSFSVSEASMSVAHRHLEEFTGERHMIINAPAEAL